VRRRRGAIPCQRKRRAAAKAAARQKVGRAQNLFRLGWHVPHAGAWPGCLRAPARPGRRQPEPPRDKRPGGRIVGRDRVACTLCGCTPARAPPDAAARVQVGCRVAYTACRRTAGLHASSDSAARPQVDFDQNDQNEAVNQAGQIIGAFQKAAGGVGVSDNALQPYDEARGPPSRGPRCLDRAHLTRAPGAACELPAWRSAKRLAASIALAGGLVRARCRGRAGVRAGAVPGDRADPRVRPAFAGSRAAYRDALALTPSCRSSCRIGVMFPQAAWQPTSARGPSPAAQ